MTRAFIEIVSAQGEGGRGGKRGRGELFRRVAIDGRERERGNRDELTAIGRELLEDLVGRLGSLRERAKMNGGGKSQAFSFSCGELQSWTRRTTIVPWRTAFAHRVAEVRQAERQGEGCKEDIEDGRSIEIKGPYENLPEGLLFLWRERSVVLRGSHHDGLGRKGVKG
jgi:hypothetical protein